MDAAAPKRELAAIMFSDIASYTAIMGRDEQEGLEARNSHRELLRTILPRFNGRLLGDLGDGALSSFHSAIDAVNCARALQAATGDNPQFRIRIGIHVGDVLFSDNTVLGDGVNVASRIVALAKASAMSEELNHKSLHGYVPPFNLAIVYLGMGERERALDDLEKAYRAHSEWMNILKMDRIFDPLRSEPRFIALMKKVNLEK
jgi:hypothetical protein